MSIKKDEFHKKYNHLQMDKYLIESNKIKDNNKKLKFWNDLIINYKKDKNELENINSVFGALISVDSEFRYKKGGILSSDFVSFCKKQIELLKYEKISYSDPATKKRIYTRLAVSTFFKVSNIVFEPEPIDKPIFLTIDNWNKNKETFIKQRFETYENKDLKIKQIKDLEIKEVESLPFNDNFEMLKKWYKEALNNLDKKPSLKNIDFNPNQFNEDGAKLFNYLVENYIETKKERGLQKRFTNVWHFMKNDNQKKDTYKFYFTKDEYKIFVLKAFKLKITNTDKSEYKYPEVDLIQLKDHVLAFEDLYKS